MSSQVKFLAYFSHNFSPSPSRIFGILSYCFCLLLLIQELHKEQSWSFKIATYFVYNANLVIDNTIIFIFLIHFIYGISMERITVVTKYTQQLCFCRAVSLYTEENDLLIHITALCILLATMVASHTPLYMQ